MEKYIYSPLVICHENGCTINYNYELNDKPSLLFDEQLPFNPYEIYMNGELSIMYLLKQNSLISKEATVKCEITDAKNALKLHESDVHYLYKPLKITENEQFYKMIYRLPDDYEIPLNLNIASGITQSQIRSIMMIVNKKIKSY